MTSLILVWALVGYELQETAARIRVAEQLPAFGVAVVRGDQIDFAVDGVRRADRTRKVQKGDRWLIGSVTKSMTATMIARLVDRGMLRWDETLAEALPTTPMRPEYRSVTILQVLRHRGGIPPMRDMDGDTFDRIVGDAHEPSRIREKLAREAFRMDPVKGFEYSNAGYTVLGLIAEQAAKKPYESLMRDEVFAPLGMKTAHIGRIDAERDVVGHEEKDGKASPVTPYDARFCAAFAPGGIGVSMSIGDLARLVRYHLAGQRGSVTLMRRENFDMLHAHPEGDYSGGWVEQPARPSGGSPRAFPDGYSGHEGSDSTSICEVAIFPSQDLAVVAVTNAPRTEDPTPPLVAIREIYLRVTGGR